jgi:hypothetical protein
MEQLKESLIPDIVVRYFQDDKKCDRWIVYLPITVQLSNGDIITIPEGYITDFASIPQILWFIMPPIGKFNFAVLVHDWLYDTRYKNDRKFADLEMKYWMKIASVPRFQRFLMYIAVRAFGSKWFKN